MDAPRWHPVDAVDLGQANTATGQNVFGFAEDNLHVPSAEAVVRSCASRQLLDQGCTTHTLLPFPLTLAWRQPTRSLKAARFIANNGDVEPRRLRDNPDGRRLHRSDMLVIGADALKAKRLDERRPCSGLPVAELGGGGQIPRALQSISMAPESVSAETRTRSGDCMGRGHLSSDRA